MLKLTGNEKAFLGGLLAFLSTSIIQLQQTAGYTLNDFCWSVGAWVVVHLGVWLTTNSVSADVTPEPQVLSEPVAPPTPSAQPPASA